MSKFNNIIRWLAGWLFLTGSILLLPTCSIKEDFSDCIVDEYLLYVTVLDDNADITETGTIENAFVYLFNDENKVVSIYELDAAQIANREPIVLYGMDPNGMQVVAWGNMGDRTQLSPTRPGDQLDNLRVSLVSNPAEPGYNLRPDEIYFGSSPLAFITRSTATHSQEVVITPKNARLHITVRGLDMPPGEGDNNYHFRLITPRSGYTFQGNPIADRSILKEKGAFNDRKEYITPGPWQMIHSANPGNPSEDDAVRIEVYEENENNDMLLISTQTDYSGNYITLTSGKTTNVLIDLLSGGLMNIQVRVTQWNEIHQWIVH